MARKIYKKKFNKKPKKGSEASTVKIQKVVSDMLSTRVEKRTFTYNFPNSTILSAYGGSIFQTTGTWALSPYIGFMDIVQGSGQGQRTANSFRVASAKLALIFSPTSYSSTLNPNPGPLYISIYFFYQRTTPCDLPGLLPDFYQNGNSSITPSTSGFLVDSLYPINKDRWVVKKKIVRKLGFGQYQSGNNTVAYQQYTNNDFKMSQKVVVDYTKLLPKIIRYNDTTAIPTSRGLFMAILLHGANGVALNNTFQYALMSGMTTISYTDM